MTAETTLTSAWAWHPDLAAIPPTDAVPAALVLTTSTVAGSVEGDEVAVRVPFVDDAVAGFVAEGSGISEADPDLAECIVHTGKVAQLIRLSREQFEQPNASTLLAASITRAVTKAANLAYIAQAAPVGPATTPPAGLLNVANVVDGGDVFDDVGLDRLVDLQATLAENGATTSHVVLAPSAWAALRRIKDEATSARSLLGLGTTDTAPSLLNVPVVVDASVPANTGLMIDKNAVVSAVGRVQVAQSEHVYFDSDSVALRCTWRFGANVVHPDRVAFFTVDDGS